MYLKFLLGYFFITYDEKILKATSYNLMSSMDNELDIIKKLKQIIDTISAEYLKIKFSKEKIIMNC